MEDKRSLTCFEHLQKKPGSFDFFQAVRIIENLRRELPVIGSALISKNDSVRFGQNPSMNFASTELSKVTINESDNKITMLLNFFGLLGVNGPMPAFFTEQVQYMCFEKKKELLDFINLFNHRFISFFYKAWFINNIVANSEKHDFDRFKKYFYSLIGECYQEFMEGSSLPVNLKLFFSGHLMHIEKNKKSLLSVIKGYFHIPVNIEESVETFLSVPESEVFRLGKGNSMIYSLGKGIFLGSKVWNKTIKFRVILGPLGLEEYINFLPGTNAFSQLKEIIGHFSPPDLIYDINYILRAEDVSLGRSNGALGYSFWMFCQKPVNNLDNLLVEVS